MTKFNDAIAQAQLEWQIEHGKCSICDTGDRPNEQGWHRGQHRCGNADSCLICHGCLPSGEICQACFRMNVYDYQC